MAINRLTVAEETRYTSDSREFTPAQLAADPALTGSYVGGIFPQKYGAKGDGVANDAAAIQSAINAAATFGGFVYLPAGTYRITSALTLLPFVKIQGAGIESTIIKVGNGANCDVLVGQNYASLTGGGTAGGIGEWGLFDFKIDGNRANNSSGDGIKVYGYGFRWNNVIVEAMAGRGVVTEWSATDEPATSTSEAMCSNVKVLRCGGNGVEWAGPHDSQLSNWIVALNNQSGTAGGVGFWLKNGSGAAQIVNCHVWGTSHKDGWLIDAAAYLVCCVSDGSTDRGMVVRQNDVQIVGSHIFVYPAQSPAAKGLVIGDATHTGIAGSNIDVKVSNCQSGAVDVTYMGAYNRVRLMNYQTTGTTLIGTPASTNDFDLICNGGVGSNVKMVSNPGWTSFTPAVTGLSSFVLGNGTITGAWKLVGKVVEFRCVLNVGSTTTFGTGTMALGGSALPAATGAAQAVGIYYHNANGRGYALVGQVGPGGQAFTLAYSAGFLQPSAAEPIAVGNGDSIALSGSYEAA